MTTYLIGKYMLEELALPLALIILDLNIAIRFVKNLNFSEIERLIEVAMKEKHTVIEKWPFRLKLRPGQPGAQEEFDRLVGGGVSGEERYMEWRRVSMYKDEMDRR